MNKQNFEVVGTTVYQLEFDRYSRGKEVMRNRLYANVQGYRDTPVEELEATARLFASAPELLAALEDSQALILQLYEQGYSVHEEMRANEAAIAKAEGK